MCAGGGCCLVFIFCFVCFGCFGLVFCCFLMSDLLYENKLIRQENRSLEVSEWNCFLQMFQIWKLLKAKYKFCKLNSACNLELLMRPEFLSCTKSVCICTVQCFLMI